MRVPNSMTSDLAPGPLFVVSMWRSGSSLLYALLNQHPQIALMYEAELPVLWPVFRKPVGSSDWPERWDFWNQAVTRHQVDAEKIPPNLSDLKSASRAVFGEYARKKGATIWGDKSPNYYDSMNRLARLFPNARFIVVWRNPADTCRSILRAAAAGSSYFRKRGMTLRAVLGYRRFKAEYDNLVARGIPVYPVDYEQLTRDPAGLMPEICAFLRIPFDPRMSSLEGADRSALYGGEHHALVRGDRIVARSKRPDNLPPSLKKKIARYISLWREESGGTWPAFCDPLDSDPGKPTIFERLFDEIRYRSLRTFDLITAWVYSFVPLFVLREYREAKAIIRSPGQIRNRVMQRLFGMLGL